MTRQEQLLRYRNRYENGRYMGGYPGDTQGTDVHAVFCWVSAAYCDRSVCAAGHGILASDVKNIMQRIFSAVSAGSIGTYNIIRCLCSVL